MGTTGSDGQLPRGCAAALGAQIAALGAIPTAHNRSVMAIDQSPLSIDAERLNASIHETAEFGAALRYGEGPTETGMARLALDDNDARVRRWFVEQVQNAGCKVIVDELGNIFAIRPGKKAGPPTAMGSHLDTQSTGGRYDGILGVLSGVEVMRTLHDNGIVTEFPVAVVDWTNEEGARFPKTVVASGVWAGDLDLETAYKLADVNDPTATMKSELTRIGFLGDIKCSHEAMPLAAHFELHIARCIVANNAIAKKHGALSSTGILTLSPGSTNVCPSHVRFSLDIRHPTTAGLNETCASINAEMLRIAAEDSEQGCRLEITVDRDSDAPVFDETAINCVRASAVATVGPDQVLEMYSGAAHDSCSTARRAPTAMVFVPSKDGISHNPTEYTSPKDCATGAQVLLHAVLNYDKQRQA
ncbi:hypothetical protein JCM3770_003955 [Rhodotorula araucariae]